MKRVFFALLVVLVAQSVGFGFERHFRLVKTIGDDRDNYMFQRLSGAALTEEREIVVCDQLGNFVAKYDWQGNFIHSIGQKGKGPGDFLMPTHLRALDKKLYLLDHFNARFVEMDSNLENFHYYKLDRSIFLRPSFDVLNHDTFLATAMNCVSNPQIEGMGKVLHFEKGKGVQKAFFDIHPTKKRVDAAKDKWLSHKMDLFGEVIWGLDDSRERLLVSYIHPANPLAFYLCSTSGKQLLEFEYEIDKKYSYPMRLITANKMSLDLLKDIHLANIGGIVNFADNWYVFIDAKYYRTYKDYDRRTFCLKFSSEGTFEERFDIEDGFVPFAFTKDGYLLGKRPDAEVEKLFIYKITK